MKSDLPKTSRGFAEVLQGVLRRDSWVRNKLLRTTSVSGYITDGTALSRLRTSEVREVNQLHLNALASESEYREVKPFSLKKVLPEELSSREVEQVKLAGGNEKTKVVLLTGGRLRAYAEAKAYSFLNARHPEALWLFAAGEGYWSQPIVLVERAGCFAGEVLGVLATVKVRPSEEAAALCPKARWFRCRSQGRWWYKRDADQSKS